MWENLQFWSDGYTYLFTELMNSTEIAAKIDYAAKRDELQFTEFFFNVGTRKIVFKYKAVCPNAHLFNVKLNLSSPFKFNFPEAI